MCCSTWIRRRKKYKHIIRLSSTQVRRPILFSVLIYACARTVFSCFFLHKDFFSFWSVYLSAHLSSAFASLGKYEPCFWIHLDQRLYNHLDENQIWKSVISCPSFDGRFPVIGLGMAALTAECTVTRSKAKLRRRLSSSVIDQWRRKGHQDC